MIDADLGGGLVKQRVARPGEGRTGGYRTIVAYRSKGQAFFVYGFAKSERGNIDADDLRSFKEAAKAYLSLDAKMLASLVKSGRLMEVNCNG